MTDHAAIIIRKGKDVLFVKRSMTKKVLPGAWGFPSGTRPEHETPFETAKREAMEELGVEVRPEKLLCTQELPEFGVTLHFILCAVTRGEPEIREHNEIAELLWLPFKDFLDRYDDSQIGHGLVWIRKNPQLWASLI